MDLVLDVAAQTRAAEAFAKRHDFVRYPSKGPLPTVQVMLGQAAGRTPHFTVIIPTAGRGRAALLEHLLTQIHKQTFQDFEVILVSGDRRQGRAINLAATMARGALLLTLDDDTALGATTLFAEIVRELEADATIGAAGVANVVPDDVPWIVQRALRELPRRSSPVVTKVTESDLAEHPCLAIRRDVFYRVGGEHEQIPRGLDPYLRQEIRKLGYRVVVLPNLWIHHLLPSSFRGILRAYYRNGLAAAYVKKFYPAFIVDQAIVHDQKIPEAGTLVHRSLRYVGRMGGAFMSLRWIYLSALASYALGYVWGLQSLRKDTL